MSSNLPRVTQKIFAENTETNIGQFGSAKNGSPFRTGDIQQIQALTAWGEGWDAAVISDRNYPLLEEMTGVQKVFSQQIAYILQKGMPEWDSGTTYFQNDMCRVGSMFYYSKTDNNTGNNPDTDTTNWGRWNPAEGTYANIDLSNLSSEGQAILDSKLNHSQVTNCILANNGAEITTQSYEGAAYVNNGCTVSEAGVASGFGANNFILLNKTMTDANAFVMTIPFKVNSTAGIQPLAAISNQDNCIQLDGGVLALKYNGLELKGVVTVSAATQYYAVLTRTETGYTLELKDSTEPETEALDTINLTSTAGFFGGKPIYLGVDKSGNFLNGEIDLAQQTITAGGEAYWSNATTLDFETVTLSGSLQVLMPNGRNADQTLKNVEQTITLNDVLLFNNSTGSTKTVLVKEDGEVMIRDFYTESDNAPEVPLNGIWFDTDNNVMNTQLNTYPNFINTGVTINEGVVSGFSEEDYLQLPEQYNLGNNWDITLAVTPASTTPTEPTQPTDATTPTDATSDTTPIEPTEATPCGLIGNIEVSGEDYIPDGVGLIYDGTGSVTAVFRRADVYNVRKTVVLSTAYEVQKGTDSTIGYVQTAGDEGSYVTAETQVYSDPQFSIPLETAAADTWQYTGETQDNTQTIDGFTKTAGSTLVPAETVIYADANCTSVQGTASGTDYVYTGATSVSIIGTLTDTVTAGQENSITLSYDGANYKLNQKTLASTDNIRNTIAIPLGKALSTGGYFTGTINLNNSTFSFWTWNGVDEAVADLVPFVGVKIGQITLNDGVISSTTIDKPLKLSGASTNFSELPLFTMMEFDHVLEGADAIGWALQGSLITMTYPDAVNNVIEAYTSGVETTYREIPCKKATDGRYIADIAQKTAIDSLFNSSGVADFYILDSTNNQFYLPRNKWFHQLTDSAEYVNNYNAPGLPNITGSFSATDDNYYNGAFYNAGGSAGATSGTNAQHITGFDASRSNSIYGASTTVQPPSSNKLLYYRVGNNVVNQSAINVGNVLGEMLNKADTDFGNVSSAGKAAAVGWAMPDLEKGVQLSTLDTWILADKDYYARLTLNTEKNSLSGDKAGILIGNTNSGDDYLIGFSILAGYFGVCCSCICPKGYYFKAYTNGIGSATFIIYPLKGVNNA